MGLGQRLGPRLGRQPLACESTGTIQALPYILMRSLKTCGARRGKGYVRHTRGWHTCSGAHKIAREGGEGGGELPCASGTYSTQEAGTRTCSTACSACQLS